MSNTEQTPTHHTPWMQTPKVERYVTALDGSWYAVDYSLDRGNQVHGPFDTEETAANAPTHEQEHKPRVYVSDHGNGWHSWRCSCGQQGAPDYLHTEYARDGWREAHDLAPLVNRPLV